MTVRGTPCRFKRVALGRAGQHLEAESSAGQEKKYLAWEAVWILDRYENGRGGWRGQSGLAAVRLLGEGERRRGRI